MTEGEAREIRQKTVTEQMKFSIQHTSCTYKYMDDITQNPEMLDRNVERPFRVFRCPNCNLEIKVEKLGG